MKLLDRNGKELGVGMRVRRKLVMSEGWSHPETVRGFVRLRSGGPLRVRTQAAVSLPLSPTPQPNTYRCPDLEALPDNKGGMDDG